MIGRIVLLVIAVALLLACIGKLRLAEGAAAAGGRRRVGAQVPGLRRLRRRDARLHLRAGRLPAAGDAA